MFTGLITETGSVVQLRLKRPGASLIADAASLARDAVVGDSVAVNGACLTVVSVEGSRLTFDLSDETMQSTTLGFAKPGDRVNLEPSLRADGKLGGHFVTGHVDGVGTIRAKTPVGDAVKIVIEAPPEVTVFLVGKGSVAVDGISLTVVDVSGDSFSVVIIPHTAKATTIGLKGSGERVNLEADIIGKYVARFVSGRVAERTGGDERLLQSMRKAGYL
jgi:riboflavin synthase